jgi:hypothetical protein
MPHFWCADVCCADEADVDSDNLNDRFGSFLHWNLQILDGVIAFQAILFT